ncbi:MAG: L-serine ammonia-lyase [Candidatus Delongbacteria bacterium]|nr:L-serine ammonia-lyase [Candidatus Delongbacteria bacterium]MBN2834322.1 L-serine ammonia-lyase [Candidatus Delongbacteria bacterium]
MSFRSVTEVFKKAVGPSSSHTLGPLKAAGLFISTVYNSDILHEISNIQVELHGSFAYTGVGHLTHIAVSAGLSGFNIDRDIHPIRDNYMFLSLEKTIRDNNISIKFDPLTDIIYIKESCFELSHPNTLVFKAFDEKDNVKITKTYLSVGGGHIIEDGENQTTRIQRKLSKPVFYGFSDIIEYCKQNNINLIDFIYSNELDEHDKNRDEVDNYLRKMWTIMSDSVERGIKATGILSGPLKLRRKANEMYFNFINGIRQWNLLAKEITLVTIYGIAASEENADGGVVVTAPTCGSAGIIPAVLKILWEKFNLNEDKMIEALLISGFIGSIIIKLGSISGAEVGCQGEVGSASAMAAGAACYLMGGDIDQIECAAEIALEHHLGLICDPVGGLVQVPCVERNGVGAVSALNAANLALLSMKGHVVSFDEAVKTMKEVGVDMNCKYKETSLGGLAILGKC